MKIILCGDLHGNWGALNTLINKKQPDIVFQCGDFGWWPQWEVTQPVLYGRQKVWSHKGLKPNNTKVYFCDGNHEQHSILTQNGKIQELYKNVFFCSRGSLLQLEDLNILFAGGASSIDKDQRTPGHDWFSKENINRTEYSLLTSHQTIDIVISHTCPNSFNIHGTEGKLQDSNRIALEDVLNKYSPALWVFGHWHKFQLGHYKETNWFCLDYPGHGSQWWMEITL